MVPMVTVACTMDGLFREESGVGRAGTLGSAAVPSLHHTSALLGPLASDPEVSVARSVLSSQVLRGCTCRDGAG